jgi:hypothetical protein
MNSVILKAVYFVIGLSLMGTASLADDDRLFPMQFSEIITCPADEQPYELGESQVTEPDNTKSDSIIPDFSAAKCHKVGDGQVNPQGKLIWFQGTIHLPESVIEAGVPLSLYVSGKMSSRIYLNGQYIASNGVPSRTADTEKAGLMDYQVFPPTGLIKAGDNTITLLASSHLGVLELYAPLHFIAFKPATTPENPLLSRYIPALLTLGLFFVGIIYYGVASALNPLNRYDYAIFSAVCFFAAAQLISESIRGFYDYPYPFQDIRLLAITGFSSAFGLSIAFYVFRTFAKPLSLRILSALTLINIIALIVMPSFDMKALTGMTIPLIASFFAALWWSYKRRPRAFLHFLALLIFLTVLINFKGLFLDQVFFFLVAGLLLVLFIEQAVTLSRESKHRRREEERANRLEQALAEKAERDQSSSITVKSAGQVKKLSTDQIIWCKSIDGYCEITLNTGQTILHSLTLNELEQSLPKTFLRVHRSHIVNSHYIVSLKREPSGTGSLHLENALTVPVSRRIMPNIRKAIT